MSVRNRRVDPAKKMLIRNMNCAGKGIKSILCISLTQEAHPHLSDHSVFIPQRNQELSTNQLFLLKPSYAYTQSPHTHTPPPQLLGMLPEGMSCPAPYLFTRSLYAGDKRAAGMRREQAHRGCKLLLIVVAHAC